MKFFSKRKAQSTNNSHAHEQAHRYADSAGNPMLNHTETGALSMIGHDFCIHKFKSKDVKDNFISYREAITTLLENNPKQTSINVRITSEAQLFCIKNVLQRNRHILDARFNCRYKAFGEAEEKQLLDYALQIEEILIDNRIQAGRLLPKQTKKSPEDDDPNSHALFQLELTYL